MMDFVKNQHGHVINNNNGEYRKFLLAREKFKKHNNMQHILEQIQIDIQDIKILIQDVFENKTSGIN